MNELDIKIGEWRKLSIDQLKGLASRICEWEQKARADAESCRKHYGNNDTYMENQYSARAEILTLQYSTVWVLIREKELGV